MLIIGDIAGQFDTLMALLRKCPDEEPISVGDMIDRGPKSKEVLDFFSKHGRAVLGNHEEFLLHSHLHPEDKWAEKQWMCNGGRATVASLGWNGVDVYANWLKTLPLYIQENGVTITHAPIPRDMDDVPMEEVAKLKPDFLLWNRDYPALREDGFQVFGHNSYWGLMRLGHWAMCIDTSGSRTLTALQWPQMTIYQQDYV